MQTKQLSWSGITYTEYSSSDSNEEADTIQPGAGSSGVFSTVLAHGLFRSWPKYRRIQTIGMKIRYFDSISVLPEGILQL